QRLAHARVLEFVAAGIDEPALRARWRFVGQGLALDAAVLDRREIVARRPDPRGEFFAKQIIPGGEPLEGDITVAIELITYHIEVIAAARDGQIAAPPILDTLEF